MLALAACTNVAETPDAYARVNDRVITHAEVERAVRNAHATGGAPREKAVLEALISQELAAQRAQQLELKPDEAGRKELARAQAELDAVRRRVLSSALYAQTELQAANVSSDEAHAYFQAHASDLRRQTHVLMVMRRSADELGQMRTAVAGGTPFDDCARGLWPEGTAGRPWDLGYLSWAQMPGPWREAVRTLKAGELSPVIAGDHGRFWLLEVVDVREGPELSFDAALPQIRQAIAVEYGSKARDALDVQLRRRAHIIYAPSRGEPVAALSDD
jgi:hypothetical protein